MQQVIFTGIPSLYIQVNNVTNIEPPQSNNLPIRPLSVELVMVCVYMFLIIERPWESIRHLEGIPIERFFAIAMIFMVTLRGKLKLVSSPTNKWVYGLLALHFVLVPFAFKAEAAVYQGIEYGKMVIFYLLLLAVADDEKSLNILLKAFVFSMMFYVMHSLWEYHNGRHDYKMGITRMLGVGTSFSDPNAFGASIALSFPFVYILIRCELNNWIKISCYSYYLVALFCIISTGSRSTIVATLILSAIWLFSHNIKKIIFLFPLIALTLAIIWNVAPQEKQIRIRTLWDKEAGPASAHESSKGRMIGWLVSWEMFKQKPLTGVGPGEDNFIGYRMASNLDYVVGYTPTPLQSHVLYGQVLAAFGLPGFIAFAGLVLAIWNNCVGVLKKRGVQPGNTDCFIRETSKAIMISLFLLLFFGFAGHNFYRPLWLWLAAWSGSLALVTRARKTKSSDTASSNAK